MNSDYLIGINNANKEVDLPFEVQDYFSRNNYRNVELAKLNLVEINTHADVLARELSEFERVPQYRGDTKTVRDEMISFINYSLGIK